MALSTSSAAMRKIFLVLSMVLVGLVAYSMAGVAKRDINLEDLKNDIQNELPGQNKICITDDSCSTVEHCDSDFHCKMHLWFIGSVVGAGVFILFALGASCICCPCCCLYSMCRKG
jgi:hypothetical protein